MNTKSNLPSNKHYFSNSENKAWKKINNKDYC